MLKHRLLVIVLGSLLLGGCGKQNDWALLSSLSTAGRTDLNYGNGTEPQDLDPQIVTGVPENKQAGLIPAGWFEHWAGVTWATDPEGSRRNPPVVRAPNGDEAWVKAQMVDGGSSVMRTRPGDLPLLDKPKPGAKVVAYLRSGAVAIQLKSKDGWNQLRAGGEKGWAPADEVWGGGPTPDCKGVKVPAG